MLPDAAQCWVMNQMVQVSFPFPLRDTWGDWLCTRCEHRRGVTAAVGVEAVPTQAPLCGLVFACTTQVSCSLWGISLKPSWSLAVISRPMSGTRDNFSVTVTYLHAGAIELHLCCPAKSTGPFVAAALENRCLIHGGGRQQGEGRGFRCF